MQVSIYLCVKAAKLNVISHEWTNRRIMVWWWFIIETSSRLTILKLYLDFVLLRYLRLGFIYAQSTTFEVGNISVVPWQNSNIKNVLSAFFMPMWLMCYIYIHAKQKIYVTWEASIFQSLTSMIYVNTGTQHTIRKGCLQYSHAIFKINIK